MNLDIYIGKRIYSRRRALGYSQSMLGNEIKTTFQQIQRYEKGQNKISAHKLFEISIALKVPMNYFFEGFIYNSEPSSELSVAEEAKKFDYDLPNNCENDFLIKLKRSLHKKETRKEFLQFLKDLD